VRLGTWMPFPAAARLLAAFTRTALSEPTVRRQTEAAGAAYVALQTAAAERLERVAPAPPPGPAVLQVSVDGAMVPLVGQGQWAEVKTLAIGVVPPRGAGAAARTTALSYFSRLADHQTFTRLALVETHRRGVEAAGAVVAISDGAGWAQHFADAHCPGATRILDWCHAAGYLGQVASACFGAADGGAQQWLAAQVRELLEGDPDRVLGKLRGLRDGLAAAPDAAAPARLATVAASLHYLESRRAQIAYAEFRALGYPIGSGAVERANKLVVEARLKGAGMHWARRHVDPLAALRTVVCADRWAEAWPQIAAELRRQGRARLRRKRLARRPATPPPPMVAPAAPAPPRVLALPTSRHDTPPHADLACVGPSLRPRPRPAHPWRRYPQRTAVN
jgi:hypothetical protein